MVFFVIFLFLTCGESVGDFNALDQAAGVLDQFVGAGRQRLDVGALTAVDHQGPEFGQRPTQLRYGFQLPHLVPVERRPHACVDAAHRL